MTKRATFETRTRDLRFTKPSGTEQGSEGSGDVEPGSGITLGDLGRQAVDYATQVGECLFCSIGDHDGDGGERHDDDCPVGLYKRERGMGEP